MQEVRPSEDSLQQSVERLAALAWDCGCDGLVCSAADLPRLRQAVGREPLVVTPGIRPAGSDAGDQHRVTTPALAVAAGADFLVIGRPITQAGGPGGGPGRHRRTRSQDSRERMGSAPLDPRPSEVRRDDRGKSPGTDEGTGRPAPGAFPAEQRPPQRYLLPVRAHPAVSRTGPRTGRSHGAFLRRRRPATWWSVPRWAAS